MKHGRILLLAALALSTQAKAVITTDVEQIIGYERYQKLVPTPHTRERLVYGARVTVGLPLISGEVEYTRGTDTETFVTNPTMVKETEDKARVGARSTFRLGGMVHLFARAGAQAKIIKREQTIGAATVSSTDPMKVNPYGGAGLKVKLSRRISFTADLTVVFRDFPDMSQNDYMTTAGFAVSFP